jgi:hypothetical protein
MFDIVSTVFLNSLRFHHRFDDRESNARDEHNNKRNQFVAGKQKQRKKKHILCLKQLIRDQDVVCRCINKA